MAAEAEAARPGPRPARGRPGTAPPAPGSCGRGIWAPPGQPRRGPFKSRSARSATRKWRPRCPGSGRRAAAGWVKMPLPVQVFNLQVSSRPSPRPAPQAGPRSSPLARPALPLSPFGSRPAVGQGRGCGQSGQDEGRPGPLAPGRAVPRPSRRYGRPFPAGRGRGRQPERQPAGLCAAL